MEQNETNETMSVDGSDKPFPDGDHRLPNGRFGKGNPGGPGNPHARRVSRLRVLLLDAVTDDDLRAIVQRLVQLAKDGDLPAIREVFDRMVGKPAQTDLIQRIEELEEVINNKVKAAS